MQTQQKIESRGFSSCMRASSQSRRSVEVLSVSSTTAATGTSACLTMKVLVGSSVSLGKKKFVLSLSKTGGRYVLLQPA